MYMYTYLTVLTYPTIPSRYLCTAEVKEDNSKCKEDQFINKVISHHKLHLGTVYTTTKKINHTHPATSLYRP